MVFLVGETVGIDFGTTYSSLAHLGPDGNPVTISNADGMLRASSVVLLSENGRVLVSPSFERISIEDPSHIVEAIKRQMGNRDFYIVYEGKRLSPEFISALIMKKLKQDSEKQIGPIANAVITVPYYFNENCRKATQDAGQIAGLNVIDILDEPTAATLAYNWLESGFGRANLPSQETTLLVFDLGGGKFEVTAVRYNQKTIHVLASEADVTLAGSNWTQRIVDYVCEEFKRNLTEDPRGDPVGLRVIFEKCEDAKRQLSAVSQVPICIQHREQILNVLLTRDDFERITADLLQRTANATARVLQQAKGDSGDVDQVILVGGATAMPAVGEMLQRLCTHPQSRDFRAEEAVALGAAIHAGNLERDWRDCSRFPRW